jgi:methyl-accepting chemotaxis protein
MQSMKLRHILATGAGVVLIIAGVAGLIFSIVGLVAVAQLERRVEATLTEQIKQVDEALVATSDGLITAGTLLTTAIDISGSVQETTAYAGKKLQDGLFVLDLTHELVEKQFPATIGSTQKALTSMATSAKLVDDILAALTAVPLLGMDRYSPEVPLSQGLTEVARSLDDMPRSLDKIEVELTSTQDKLKVVGENLTSTKDRLGQITTGLKDAQSVIARYQEVVTNVQGLSSSALRSLPGWLRALRWGLSLALIWFGIAQIVLLTQGWDLVARSRAATPAAPKAPEV